MRFCNVGSSSALSSAAASLSAIGFGVPFGANTALQILMEKSGSPTSLADGTFGIAAERLSPETA